MRIIVQNVIDAHLSIDNRQLCAIDRGYVLLVGFTAGDSGDVVNKMVDKIVRMRVFQDENGKTNLAIGDVQGAILAVPQFTLYADLSGGRRPSFTKVLNPDDAERLFDHFVESLKASYADVCSGVFGADMKVNLTNDGPFTLILDSEDL
ncbi:MAG: D-aminoacyl-tRNA deacylase [Bacilli bacterium]|jgi:D-tyrosyl-tRNA(Tyr) deacylase